MKHTLTVLCLVATFAACKNKPTEEKTVAPTKVVVYEKEKSDAGYDAASTSNTTEAPKKKGMSDGAKGAIIGGVVGAGTGALIDGKDGNRTEGAVIGGVVGAGAGYLIGHSKDKKKKAATSGN